MNKTTITPQELDVWRSYRRLAEVISARIAQDIMRATGLSAADFSVLMVLDQAEDGSRKQRDVQSFLDWDKTRLSHQLTRMADRGLVRRGSGDGTGVTISMTSEGRLQLAGARPVHLEGVREYFLNHLSEADLVNMQVIGNKLREVLLKP